MTNKDLIPKIRQAFQPLSDAILTAEKEAANRKVVDNDRVASIRDDIDKQYHLLMYDADKDVAAKAKKEYAKWIRRGRIVTMIYPQ